MKHPISNVFRHVFPAAFTGLASDRLPGTPLDPEEITSIQAILPPQNPEAAPFCKTITDAAEIAAMTELLNAAALTKRVRPGDLAIAFDSTYSIYRGETLLCVLAFNGADTRRIWVNGSCYQVLYEDETPFELIDRSAAPFLREPMRPQKRPA